MGLAQYPNRPDRAPHWIPCKKIIEMLEGVCCKPRLWEMSCDSNVLRQTMKDARLDVTPSGLQLSLPPVSEYHSVLHMIDKLLC
jgi:hypothetical protein